MGALSDLVPLADLGLTDGRLLLAAAVFIVGGFLRGFIGFGSALVVVPVLSLAYGPRVGVAAFTVVEVAAIVRLLPDAVRHADRRTTLPLIATIVLAAPLGTWALANIDVRLMKGVISGTVLAMVALIALNWRFRQAARMPVVLAAGALSGLIQGSTGVGGPPVVALFLSRPDPPDTIRGNILAGLGSLGLIVVVVYGTFGLLTPLVLWLGVLAMPPYLIAIGLGARYYSREGNRFYRSAALVVLSAIALATLAAALTTG